MDRICAIIDTQGFQFEDRFVARELAIASISGDSQCIEFNPQMNWRDLCKEDQRVIYHTTNHINGLHYCPFNPVEHSFLYHSDEIGKVILNWYDYIATEDKPFFGYKNQQLGKILKNLDIQTINLDDPKYKFPRYADIQEEYGDNYLCSYHKKPKINKPIHDKNNFKKEKIDELKFTCSYRKANHLMRKLKEILSSNMDWNT